MCICVCCNGKCVNDNYDKVPDSEVKALLASNSYPGKPFTPAENDDLTQKLSENMTPSVKQLFSDTFGYAYEGDDTKPTDSPGKDIGKVSCIEVLDNYSEIPIGDYENVKKCMNRQFTTIETLQPPVVSQIVDETVKSASALFEDIPLYEWKSHVFNSSTSDPSNSNATQETRGVVWYAHVEDDSPTVEGAKDKVCILYYVAVSWQSKA